MSCDEVVTQADAYAIAIVCTFGIALALLWPVFAAWSSDDEADR